MKKMIALLALLCVALLPFSAMAEAAEESVLQINWSALENEVGDISASYVTLEEIGVKFWLPDVFQAVEIGEEEAANGYVAQYAIADGSAVFAVTYVEFEGGLETFVAGLESAGASNIDEMVLNGMYAISYDVADSDVGVTAICSDDAALSFIFWPMSDEGAQAVFTLISASIQAAE